jgi:hypothetical protein
MVSCDYLNLVKFKFISDKFMLIFIKHEIFNLKWLLKPKHLDMTKGA